MTVSFFELVDEVIHLEMRISNRKDNRFKKLWIAFSVMLTMKVLFSFSARAEDKPVITTRWAAEVSPQNALSEYPRPQLRRANWLNLNGEWEYAICPEAEKQPRDFDGLILVPYPVESVLSGVQKHVDFDQRLWYRRSFQAPEINNKRLLLNFGAVDWQASVWVNGQYVGEHHGGFDSFTFDITAQVQPGENEIVVSVWDPTDAGIQPRGKQIRRPHGIWYTAVTGIWQTVWLEVVPANYIQSLKLTPNAENNQLEVVVNSSGTTNEQVKVIVRDGSQTIVTGNGKTGTPFLITVPNAKLWSPSDPHLYDLIVEVASGDQVESYFGLRDITVGEDAQGINRLMLNGKPLFQFGLLDQGWWPDGLYTAPTDEALRYDLEVTKKLGFNMVRKHVKIEPARWYYWCDKIGLLVWQDMPGGEKYISGSEPDILRTKESASNFEHELKAMVDTHSNHPSIVMWVPYNEGWGQWDTERICKLLKQWDPTRLVNNASGWVDRGVGDVHDIHSYPGPQMPLRVEGDNRVAVLGEFGGLGLVMPGHVWQADRSWGYRTFTNEEELSKNYEQLVVRLHFLVEKGLSAAVYTQTTDVEIEVNGILSYDREILKLPFKIAEANKKVYQPAPALKTLVATSESKPQVWSYTENQPPADWYSPGFDDSQWKTGKAGFGDGGSPRVTPNTKWVGRDIWMRRTVKFPQSEVLSPMLRLYYDEDVEVYINNQKIGFFGGYTTDYDFFPIDKQFWKSLKPGPMTIAVHCQQTIGGQYIDVGIVDVVKQKKSD